MALAQAVQLLVIEVEAREKIQNIPDSGSDDVVAVSRHLAKRKLKDRDSIHVFGRIRLRHGELIEIRE